MLLLRIIKYYGLWDLEIIRVAWYVLITAAAALLAAMLKRLSATINRCLEAKISG